jgi:hypothetical protein
VRAAYRCYDIPYGGVDLSSTCTLQTEKDEGRAKPNNILPAVRASSNGRQHWSSSVVVGYSAVLCQSPPVFGAPVYGWRGMLATMTLHTKLLSTDDEQNTFAARTPAFVRGLLSD